MRHTLVAAFATLTDANRTRGDLMSRGIAREQIHAVGADSADIHSYDEPYSTTDAPVDRTHHESKVAHFFKSLFGNEPHEEHRQYATAYPEAVRRGSLVIAVDVRDDDELVRARDALEYNGAININERGGDAGDTAASQGYAGPTSPYAGATGGDSHLDKHFTTSAGGVTTEDRPFERERPVTSSTAGAAAGFTGETAPTGYADHSADTGRYDIGSSAKRAGTDYPETTATTAPTGAGMTGQGVGVTGTDAPADSGANNDQAGLCGDRVCVIRRPG